LDLALPKDPIENGMNERGQEISCPADNIRAYVCDVSDYEQVQACAERIRAEVSVSSVTQHRTKHCWIDAQVGDPTVLVNNAGIFRGKLLLDSTEDDIRRYILHCLT
jgi:NAD(P)-dependent dehydrogenase (short-subunit alcohol dehydrogenase family)